MIEGGINMAPDKIYVPQNNIEAGTIQELGELIVEGSIEYIRKDVSEKDTQMCNALWNLLKILYAQDSTITEVGIRAGEFRDWLISIRDRVNIPKTEL